MATSSGDNDALLSKVVNNINGDITENKLRNTHPSMKSSNTLREYNHTRYKDSIPFLRLNLIKLHFKNKSHVSLALKNIGKRQSFHYAQNKMNNKKYIRHIDGQVGFQYNFICFSYNKIRVEKKKPPKCYKQCFPSSDILCNIVPEASFKKYNNKKSNKLWNSHSINRNIIEIKSNVEKSSMLCFNVCSNFTSTIRKTMSVFQTVYSCSEIFNAIKDYFPDEKLHKICFQGTTESFLCQCFRKKHQRTLNYFERKIKVKHKTGISPNILSHISILHFPRDVKLNKCCLIFVSHCNDSGNHNRRIKRTPQINLKGKSVTRENHRITRNQKSFQPDISNREMMKHPYQFLHKIRKRNIENDTSSIFESDSIDINNATLYSLGSNVSTDGVENFNTSSNVTFDISSDIIIDPFKRRGEDGVIYIHGLFEMSVGDCRIYPETGRFEYKAAQLAIQHVNEKNVIDGYRLEMYHNDTMVSTIYMFLKLHKLL